jgi:hypothetical protein
MRRTTEERLWSRGGDESELFGAFARELAGIATDTGPARFTTWKIGMSSGDIRGAVAALAIWFGQEDEWSGCG